MLFFCHVHEPVVVICVARNTECLSDAVFSNHDAVQEPRVNHARRNSLIAKCLMYTATIVRLGDSALSSIEYNLSNPLQRLRGRSDVGQPTVWVVCFFARNARFGSPYSTDGQVVAVCAVANLATLTRVRRSTLTCSAVPRAS